MDNYQFDIINDLKPIRREVDADNSCLFSSIGYLIDRANFNEETALRFRQAIVDYLLDDKFEANLLDQPKDNYIEFIQNPKNWGGALEVKMFSEIFQIQIVCIDVKTNRADIYGEDKNYSQRIYLLYNGIHYDPLVMNLDVDVDSLTDITIFDSNDTNTFELMKYLLLEYKKQGDYVEFNSLECNDCGIKFVNENDALDHSLNYDHWNFNQV
jgi:ubiquitin thioesterase OTU1